MPGSPSAIIYERRKYDAMVKTLLSPDRVKLWEACEADSWRSNRTSAYDWKMAEVALRAELASIKQTKGA
jgi:hypothetical protein